MHNASFELETWKRIASTKASGLTLNLFLQFCALFQVNKLNFCQSDIPGASLSRRQPTYETYQPHFGASLTHYA
jgi:hypothetical protein